MTLRARRSLICAGFTVWIVVVGYGFAGMWAYAMTPGTAATAAAQWPATSFPFDRTRPNLVAVLHPECVCSKATIETFLYDRDGRLQFSGGVTMSRGHVGPNAGTEAIRHVLQSKPALATAAVFGCFLPRGGRV